jgi:membrane protein implicated in regulation of membrane protease activity
MISGIYLGLLIYGAGVLLLGFFGVFGHEHDHDGSGETASGHDAGLGHQGGVDSVHDHEGGQVQDAHDGAHEAAHDDGQDLQRAASSIALVDRARRGGAGVAAVSRLASVLRSSVFFAFGAGATGLFAGFRGLGSFEGALWAFGAGILTLAIARLIKRFVRRDLDSSFRSEEFIMEEAVVIVPVEPGRIGKAEIKKYGADIELYIKSVDPSQALAKGERVRIIECSDDCYYVEPFSEPIAGKEI